jgi:hypothetical protein
MNKIAQVGAVAGEAASAVTPTLAKVLARMAAGAAIGGAHGYYAMPHLTGYTDAPGARKLSAFMNALMGAFAGRSVALTPGGIGAATRALVMGGKKLPLLAGTAGVDLAPNIFAALEKGREASMALANSAKVTSIPHNLGQFAQSGLGKGLVGGGAAAGMGGLLTGLLRRRNDEEERLGTGRASMAGKDMLKFLVPALAAGGIIGSLKGKPIGGAT